MSQIAARSGVNSATLYRRWGTVNALVLDAVVHDLTGRSPIPTTGDLRKDLLAYALQVQHGLGQPDGLRFLQAVAAVADTPDGEAIARKLAQRRLDELTALLQGSSGHELDAVDIVNGIIAPITYRRLLSPHLQLEQHEIGRLIDTLLAGAHARHHS